MEEKERLYKYEVVLKEKDKDGLFLTIPIDEYDLDFIVHAYTGMTQLNLFCIIKENGELTDSEKCQAFTIPWEQILYIRQIHGLKSTMEKANKKMNQDQKNLNKTLEKHKNGLRSDASIV